MGEKKLTHMDIKVDLGCEKCRRKIKYSVISLSKNQEYDEKTNTAMITVYCCSPEKIMKNIHCKGGKTVKVIKIKPPEKPKPRQPPSPPEPLPPKPVQVQCVRGHPPPPGHPNVCCWGCYERYCWGYCYESYEGCARPVYDSWGGGYGRVCWFVM